MGYYEKKKDHSQDQLAHYFDQEEVRAIHTLEYDCYDYMKFDWLYVDNLPPYSPTQQHHRLTLPPVKTFIPPKNKK